MLISGSVRRCRAGRRSLGSRAEVFGAVVLARLNGPGGARQTLGSLGIKVLMNAIEIA